MYLGIDIGTSSVKAVIVDDKDTVVEQASAHAERFPSAAGWSEQNPADWWTRDQRRREGASREACAPR